MNANQKLRRDELLNAGQQWALCRSVDDVRRFKATDKATGGK